MVHRWYASGKRAVSKDARAYKLLDVFPADLEERLKRECHFHETLLANEERFGQSSFSMKYLQPNKLEQFLLKIVVPFVRVCHCPR